MMDLSTLQVGDQLFMWHGFLGNVVSVVRVEKITPTQVVLSDGSRFNKTTGNQVGADRWNRTSLSPIDDNHAQTVLQRQRLKARLAKLDIGKLSIKDCVAISGAILAATKTED